MAGCFCFAINSMGSTVQSFALHNRKILLANKTRKTLDHRTSFFIIDEDCTSYTKNEPALFEVSMRSYDQRKRF